LELIEDRWQKRKKKGRAVHYRPIVKRSFGGGGGFYAELLVGLVGERRGKLDAKKKKKKPYLWTPEITQKVVRGRN